MVVEPKEGTNTQNLLAQFHPIMKALGYGHFELNDEGFYQASKYGKAGILGNERFVFAEVEEGTVVINMDGHSIFGLKGVEEQLNKIKEQYESSGAAAKILGPNYASALIGNLVYTALPIYSSALVVMWMMYSLGFSKSRTLNVLLYATMGVVGAKTQFG